VITEFESIGNMTLVIPRGRLDFAAAALFQVKIEQALVGAGTVPVGVLVDCAGLDYVSSAGLRVFLVATRAAKRSGIALAVCSLQPAVREVFDISGFGQLLAVHADRTAALAQMPA
jgi:anti-anti-sigma factor